MCQSGLTSILKHDNPAADALWPRPETRRRGDCETQPAWPASPACLRSEAFAEDLPEVALQAFMPPPRRCAALGSRLSLLLVATALLPGR